MWIEHFIIIQLFSFIRVIVIVVNLIIDAIYEEQEEGS